MIAGVLRAACRVVVAGCRVLGTECRVAPYRIPCARSSVQYIVLAAAGVMIAAPARAALTEGPRLAAIYDSILSAQFDRAEAQLREACPAAPAEACAALSVVSLWWQINIDAESHALDQRFADEAERALKASRAWTKREPQRAEAWFYLAGTYAPLVQWRVLRGERLAAARAGATIKSALERALKLDPSLGDAYFGIGLYHYYAGVAPAYAKVLRWLFFLPGGNRREGLREMLAAREHSEMLRFEVDYQLHLVYLWYEDRAADARDILTALDARYPANPHFLERLADVLRVYFHDAAASAAAWRNLLDRARNGRVYGAAPAAVRAHLGLAEALIDAHDPDAAIEQLQFVINADPIAPPGTRERANTLLRRAREARAKRNF